MNRALQESLVPPPLPDLPGVRVGVSYQAAGMGEVGGDFYDAWPTGADSFAVVIGDVQGKGPLAAAVTALARHTVRATSAYDPSPANVLRMLNRALLDSELKRFCTAVYIHGERAGAETRLAVGLAGHAPPIVLPIIGDVFPVGSPGTLLGVYPTIHVDIAHFVLTPGDMVVMWTDGVTDGRGGPGAVGEAQIGQIVRSAAGDGDPQAVTDAIARAVPGFEEGSLVDDVAVVALTATAAETASRRGAA
jgi:sigma-B regulation protein RsbU (phosphoserine phosphatase)